MSKQEFKIRRGVFRGGMKSRTDFNRFEKSFIKRKQRETKMRNYILILGVIILAIILLFSLRALSYSPSKKLPEQNITISNEIL